jgi:hypothetical protein
VALKTPEWLARHNGALQERGDGKWLVLLGNEPQYLLVPVPLTGRFGCAVTQTVNGKRLDSGGVHPTVEEAVSGGLEDLRKALGW